MRYQDSPDPSEFPVYPRWATWIKERSPQFKMHNHLGLAKNALSGRPLRSAHSRNHEYPLEGGYVYEWVADEEGEGWVERFHIPRGAYKSDEPLWRFTERARKARPVSQKAINDAIASIQQDQD